MTDIIDELKEAASDQVSFFDEANEDDIVLVEEEILLPIPREMRTFLLEVSHLPIGSLEPVTIADPGAHTHLPEVTATAWAEGLPREHFPICALQPGAYYFMTPEGEVGLWEHGIQTEMTWDDIWHWAEAVWLSS